MDPNSAPRSLLRPAAGRGAGGVSEGGAGAEGKDGETL